MLDPRPVAAEGQGPDQGQGEAVAIGPRADTTALAVRGLHKRYGPTVALAGVDLVVGAGEVLGLLGPNGAGKSSLLKVACGLVRADRGDVEVLGAPAGSRAARRRLGYLAERFAFPAWLSAGEVLEVYQRLAGSGGGAAERRALLERVGLGDVGDRRVGAMSKGMQQRLGLAQALVGAPSLVLLDEPTSALDPLGRIAVRELVAGLRHDGVAVVLNTHQLGDVEAVCDRVAVLRAGRVVLDAAVADVVAERPLEEAYVGVMTSPPGP